MVTVPSVVLPSVKVTVPVAVAGVTVAVSVTGKPNAHGFAEGKSVNAVLAVLTVWARVVDPLLL
jgi:hypothetical protein